MECCSSPPTKLRSSPAPSSSSTAALPPSDQWRAGTHAILRPESAGILKSDRAVCGRAKMPSPGFPCRFPAELPVEPRNHLIDRHYWSICSRNRRFFPDGREKPLLLLSRQLTARGGRD